MYAKLIFFCYSFKLLPFFYVKLTKEERSQHNSQHINKLNIIVI